MQSGLFAAGGGQVIGSGHLLVSQVRGHGDECEPSAMRCRAMSPLAGWMALSVPDSLKIKPVRKVEHGTVVGRLDPRALASALDAVPSEHRTVVTSSVLLGTEVLNISPPQDLVMMDAGH
mgnify:CR=1 FL=1